MIIPCDDPVSKGAQRFEIFTGSGKRRAWPPEVKAAIVAECYAGSEGIGAVARRHGLDPSQVYAWRKELSKQLAGNVLPMAGSPIEPTAATFVPAMIEPGTRTKPVPARRVRRKRRTKPAVVELEIDGVAVKIGRGADAGMIAAVIEALKTQR